MIKGERKFKVLISLPLFLAFLILVLFPLFATGEEFPATPAGERLKEIVTLLNEGSRQKWHDFIKKNYTQKYIEISPIDRRLQVFSQTRGYYDHLEYKRFDKSKSTDFQSTAFLWSPTMETWLKLSAKVEEKPPHKIIGLNLEYGSPPPDLEPIPKMSHQEICKELKRYAEKLAKADKFSGTVLLAKDNNILFKGAYGMASKRFDVPNRIDTKFNLGSMNKMFTSVAVAQLVEKKKLSYEDPVGKYLDSSWIQKETAEKVKIKHLLSHSSGLGSIFNGNFDKTSRLLLREIDGWKPLVKDDKPKFEPGTQWAYSNTGMFLLGPVIEKVSGMGYYDYIREYISKPAGMINSDCYEMDRPVPNLAIGYFKMFKDNGFDWHNNIFYHTIKGGPAGGGFSTVEDLFRFARALMENRLLNKESVELVTTAKPHLSSPSYGYGFIIEKSGQETIVGHSGGFAGINSALRIYKKSGYIFAVMSNYSDGAFFVGTKLKNMLLPLVTNYDRTKIEN
jgi:CubicO group peptidase (beta-lactamase class C family)